MTPRQIKSEIAKRVAAIKLDGATRRELILAEGAAEGDGYLIVTAVYEAARDWAWAAECKCHDLGQQGVEVNIHRENTDDAGIAEDDLRYWPSVLRSIEFTADVGS